MFERVVICFDRDLTIDTSDGPVPLPWTQRLKVWHYLYATGNQRLREEANIPGMPEVMGIEEGASHVGHMERHERLQAVRDRHPDMRMIVVDDDEVEGDWESYLPQDFVDAIVNGDLDLGLKP